MPPVRGRTRPAGTADRTGAEYIARLFTGPTRRYLPFVPMGPPPGGQAEPEPSDRRNASRRPASRWRRSFLLDSATDHATPRLPRAVLRTPLRGAGGPPLPHNTPADHPP